LAPLLASISMWGDNYSIYVNGFEVKSNDIYYEIAIPFLPENIVKYLEANKNYAKSEMAQLSK
jgi:hypothetical protein